MDLGRSLPRFRWPVSHGRRQDLERLADAILRSFLNRVPSREEIAARLAGLRPDATAANCATHLLRELNPATAPRFVPPGHHYSPITPVPEVERHFDRLASAGIPDALPGIRLDREAMLACWSELVPFLATMPFRAEPRAPLRFGLDNPAYAWGDGSVLHAMLRRARPRRLIEIGSGWSTLCALDTIAGSLGGGCHVTLVEPFPDLVLSLLGDGPAPDVVLARPVQEVPLATFDALEAGDVLFIDSTHVARTGSDVCYEVFEILPRLAEGVLVHVHDVFWPFEYPREWAVTENRSWTEIYLLRAFLTDNPHWEIVMFNDYLFKTARGRLEQDHPDFLRNPGGAIWLRKRPGAPVSRPGR